MQHPIQKSKWIYESCDTGILYYWQLHFLRGKSSHYTHILVLNIVENLVPDFQFQNTSSWNCTNKLAVNGQKFSVTYVTEADCLLIWWGRSTKHPKTEKENILGTIKEEKFVMHKLLLVCYTEYIY